MSEDLKMLLARVQAEDAVVRMFVATDERDWPSLEQCFTDPFTLDMTSMSGGAPAVISPREVARAWAEGFRTLDHVHHQIGNLRTTLAAARAQVRCYGIALHQRAGIVAALKTRTFVGAYEIDLRADDERWRIERLKFDLKFIDGNVELERAT